MLKKTLFKGITSAVLAMFCCSTLTGLVCSASYFRKDKSEKNGKLSPKASTETREFKDEVERVKEELKSKNGYKVVEDYHSTTEDERYYNEEEWYEEEEWNEEEESNAYVSLKGQQEYQSLTKSFNKENVESGAKSNVKNKEKEGTLGSKLGWKDIVFDEEEDN